MRLKIDSLPLTDVQSLASSLQLCNVGKKAQLSDRIAASGVKHKAIDHFIKTRYAERIRQRRAMISDEDLIYELKHVQEFSWGVVQGQLDQKIQREYVRTKARYSELMSSIEATLFSEVRNYVLCTWFNHWTTVLIEEHIGSHPRVVPTVKQIRGTDIFFDDQPFDLKITYLPHAFDSVSLPTPSELAVWMYEHQGEQRFGDDNRLFVVLIDADDRDKSWELKRDFELVFGRIDEFLLRESVSQNDAVTFSFKGKSHTAFPKVLMITKGTVRGS